MEEVVCILYFTKIVFLGIPSDSKLLTIFLPNAGTVLLTLEHLGSSKPVTLDISRGAREALGAAFNMNSKKILLEQMM